MCAHVDNEHVGCKKHRIVSETKTATYMKTVDAPEVRRREKENDLSRKHFKRKIVFLHENQYFVMKNSIL